MSEEVFLLPDVGEGLTEAEIVTWKVGVGDAVTLRTPRGEEELEVVAIE